MSVFLVFTLVFAIGAGLVPVAAHADPVTMTALAYTEYMATAQAAGMTYYGTTYQGMKTDLSVSDRQASALQAAMMSYGIMQAPANRALAGMDAGAAAIALQYATIVGMKARGTWTAFAAAAESMYAYGSYAWMKLGVWGSALFAVRALGSGAVTYPSGGAVGALAYTSAAEIAAVHAWPLWVTGQKATLAVMAQAALLGPATGNPFSWYVVADNATPDITLRTTQTFLGEAMQVQWWGGGVVVNANSDAAITAALAWAATQAAPATAPIYYPAPYLVPPPIGPDPNAPGESPTPITPVDPKICPVPLPWINSPGSQVTTTGLNPAGANPDTTLTPVPYIPPIGTNTDPIPPGGIALPGKKARDAAAALDAVIPDTFAWLKTPLVGMLNWMADLMDWLNGVWNTVCAWVSSWVIPSDAGLTAAWSRPWAALQANALSRWPFAMATVSTSLVGALTNPGAASQSLGNLSVNTTILGMPVGFDMAPSLTPLQGFQWVGQGFAWLWLVVSLFMSFRPRVVT